AAVDELLDNAAVIFVTHSMDHVRYLCQNVLLMTKGQATFSDLSTGVAGYLEQQQNKSSDAYKNLIFPPLTNFATSTQPQTIRQNKAIQAEFTISTEACINVGKMVITVLNEKDVPVARWDSEQLGLKFTLQQGTNRFSVALGPLSLSDADYEIHVSLVKQGSIKHLISDAYVGKLTSFCGRRPLEEGAHLLTNRGFRINGREHEKTTSVSV
ncbi:hypothetical protein N9B39_03130, partial [bacterium]|nr:hypothetical protein [bacterium]